MMKFRNSAYIKLIRLSQNLLYSNDLDFKVALSILIYFIEEVQEKEIRCCEIRVSAFSARHFFYTAL